MRPNSISAYFFHIYLIILINLTLSRCPAKKFFAFYGIQIHTDREEFIFDPDLLIQGAKHPYGLCLYILLSYSSVCLSRIYTKMCAK